MTNTAAVRSWSNCRLRTRQHSPAQPSTASYRTSGYIRIDTFHLRIADIHVNCRSWHGQVLKSELARGRQAFGHLCSTCAARRVCHGISQAAAPLQAVDEVLHRQADLPSLNGFAVLICLDGICMYAFVPSLHSLKHVDSRCIVIHYVHLHSHMEYCKYSQGIKSHQFCGFQSVGWGGASQGGRINFRCTMQELVKKSF